MSHNCRKIGILMGGFSAEREISLKSGRAVFDALSRSPWPVVALDVSQESEEEIRRLVSDNLIDVVFVAMHGGFGEDGRLQEILEKIPVRYTGPGIAASRIAMDKVSSHRCFLAAGLRVPPYAVVGKSRRFPLRARWLKLPLIVKPSGQGSSIGISFVRNRRELGQAVDLALRYGECALIEEFITGREVTLSVLDGQALPVVEIRPKKGFFDFEAKYQKGLTEYIVPAPLKDDVSRRLQVDAVRAYHALGCRHLSRVDMILKGDRVPYVLEVNTIPGMTEISLFPKAARAAGMAFDDLCRRLIDLACQT